MSQARSRKSRAGLSVVDPSEMTRCGAETGNGTPCERETGGGRCWQHEDAPPAGPPPPDHLGEHGRSEWNRQVSEIVQAGALGQVDLSLLEQACEVYEARRQCHRALIEMGAVVKGRRGEAKKNPAAAKLKSYATEYRLCTRELREMRESAVPQTEDDDPFDF